MAFLDNTGDIILDAVLTDAGRQRMATGRFNIAKYAFGDDEINYALFDRNHPSGSAHQDIKVMQSPILEAFTNNTSTMKSHLITLNNNNTLYLPILKLNQQWETIGDVNAVQANDYTRMNERFNTFIVTTNNTTSAHFNQEEGKSAGLGVFIGDANHAVSRNYICIDQGINSNQAVVGGVAIDPDAPALNQLDTELMETAYLIQMDNRLGTLATANNALGRYVPLIAGGATNGIQRDEASRRNHADDPISKSWSFVDDDNIATYYLGQASDSDIISSVWASYSATNDQDNAGFTNWKTTMVFDGPVGTRLRFKIKASPDITDALFTRIGTASTTLPDVGGTGAGAITTTDGAHLLGYKFIDSFVRIIGVKTGASIEIPIRYIRK